MRKTLVALLTTLFIACQPMQSYAAKGGEKGPSDRAYERASDNASFKREGGKPGKDERRRDKDSDHGHDDDDSGSKWPWQKKGEDDDSGDRKSKKKGDDDDKDESDSDHDVKSMDKKGKKEKMNKK